jgi:putative sigma-54 modulation protein
MKITIHTIHFDADVKLENFINEKVNKLDQFYDQIIEGSVFLRIDKSLTGENKVAEIKLNIPGNELFVKKQCKSFEEATDTAVEALRRQLRRYKGKVSAH